VVVNSEVFWEGGGRWVDEWQHAGAQTEKTGVRFLAGDRKT